MSDVSDGEAALAAANEARATAVRLLEDLTPGGSEFAGNPQRCAEWVEHEMVTARQRLAALRECLAKEEWRAKMYKGRAKAVEKLYDEAKADRSALRAEFGGACRALALTRAAVMWECRHLHRLDANCQMCQARNATDAALVSPLAKAVLKEEGESSE